MHANRPRAGALAALAVAALLACDKGPTSPSTPPASGGNPSAAGDSVGAKPLAGIGVFGHLDEVKGSHLVLLQQEFEFRKDPKVKDGTVRHTPPLGKGGDKLEVITDKDTKFYHAGKAVTIDSFAPPIQLMVVGTLHGGSLKADLVTDLGGLAAPPADVRPLVGASLDASRSSRRTVAAAAVPAVLSLCMGQDFDYDSDLAVKEYQGCFGGPSASDDINIPDIPFACPLIGCFVLDRFLYTMALGGWNYAFPFRFSATAPTPLVYHVPGTVTLGLTPLPATPGAFTFSGGLGLDIGLNIDFCSLFGCYDLGTFHLSAFSMIQQATGTPPLSGQTMPIPEVACPSVGVLVIPDFPLDPLAVGLCEDLTLTGAAFHARVQAPDAQPAVTRSVAFTGTTQALTGVRPNALSLAVRYDQFEYVPDLDVGLYFRLKSFGIKLWDSPTIPIASGPFDAVTTPFPRAGSAMTVATDPESPVNDLRYLYQPTLASFALSVLPAPTRLTVLSSPTLPETQPFRVRLAEDYDGSPIAGRTIAFTVQGEGTVAHLTAVTDAQGVARATLPNGEYAVDAAFAGGDVYLPSSARQAPVWVYQPTTFVVWGGNAGGVQPGGSYLFWGSRWWQEITGGAFEGNASFKGYAMPINAMLWMSPPGNAMRPPATLGLLVGTIVTTRIRGQGDNASGNVAGVVVLRVEDRAGYRPDPGHPARGTMETPLLPEPAAAP